MPRSALFTQSTDACVHGNDACGTPLIFGLPGAGSRVSAGLEQVLQQVAGDCTLGERLGLETYEPMGPGNAIVENSIARLG